MGTQLELPLEAIVFIYTHTHTSWLQYLPLHYVFKNINNEKVWSLPKMPYDKNNFVYYFKNIYKYSI